MAIHDDQPTLAPGSTQFEQRGAQPAQPRRERSGVRNLNQLMSRPLSKSAINEQLQKIYKLFSEILTNEVEINDPGFRVLMIDNQQSLTALSAIALCYLKPRQGQNYLAIHTMLVEGGTRLNTRQVSINNQQVEVITVAGDVADKEMKTRVLAAVKEVYNASSIQFLDAGANVIATEMDLEDKAAVRRMFVNAIQACYHAMIDGGAIDEAPFNAQAISSGDNMIARLDNYPPVITTCSGLPVRADISVQLQGIVGQSSQSLTERVIDITEVAGFVDLVYTPPAQMQQMGGYPGMQMQMATQRYTPRFVITDVAPCIDASTMELQLLAMASATILTDGSGGVPAWINAFKPRSGLNKDDVDTRDIGAVCLECNLTGDPNQKPSIMDTKSNKFTNQDLYRLVSATLHPNLIYSIDVDEVGDMSYLNLALVAAAGNGPDSRKAREWIIESANMLTNGVFSRLFPENQPLFFDDENRIMTGYYYNKAGEKRDIRDIDYLAVLNLIGRKEPSYIKEWSETYDRRDIPMEIRLDRRRRIYESLLGQVVIKGYARRLTFNPAFMVALPQACKESGLVFRPSNLNQDFATAGEHGIANANVLYGVAQNTSGLFSYGPSSQGNAGSGFQMPGFTGGYNIRR